MATELMFLLKQKRRELGLTMKEVAEKLDIHHSLISTYELGKRNPSLRMIKKLSDLYGIPYGELLEMRHGANLLKQTNKVSNIVYTKMLIDVLEKKNRKMLKALNTIRDLAQDHEVKKIKRVAADIIAEMES